MKEHIKKFIARTAGKLGVEIVFHGKERLKEYDEFIDLYNICKPYTMTSIERMYALYKSVEYILKHDIPGDFYECGVWRGGSSMMIALTLEKFKSRDRSLFLFDTFEGMSAPGDADLDGEGNSARSLLEKARPGNTLNNIWCYADLNDVQNNMNRTGYPADKVHYVKGKVEDTLPAFQSQEKLALLRLDTDWYESTRMELEYLFPKLEAGGVLIIDDYGFWQGAKKAVDEYMEKNKVKILLNRIDDTGRVAIKFA
ncbi:MAG: class I SAM-dependent methyltransferase [Flavipsychrobacter sp.]|nr:class I SAM-dependent methyltransferase [Flavipsychrobacter sp.]